MKIILDESLFHKSRLTYDLGQVSSYGRYVLLFYRIPPGREFEKASVFRRRLFLGGSRFEVFFVKARLGVEEASNKGSVVRGSAEDEQDDELYMPESPSESSGTVPESSQVCDDVSMQFRLGGGRQSGLIRSMFWIVMVRFEQAVTGMERFYMPVEGYPCCFVKRDLNVPGSEWLDMWQKWMKNVSIPGSVYGRFVELRGSGVRSRLPAAVGGRATGERSGYFSEVTKRGRSVMESFPKRDVEFGVGGYGSEKDFRRVGVQSSRDIRGEMLGHRVMQLEQRVCHLEDMLMRVYSS